MLPTGVAFKVNSLSNLIQRAPARSARKITVGSRRYWSSRIPPNTSSAPMISVVDNSRGWTTRAVYHASKKTKAMGGGRFGYPDVRCQILECADSSALCRCRSNRAAAVGAINRDSGHHRPGLGMAIGPLWLP